MDKDQVLKSNNLKKRFVKDVRIPLTLLENPYFEERIELYSVIYPEVQNQWKRFLTMLESFDSEQDYFEHYGYVKDKIIDTVKSSVGYDIFNSVDMNVYAVPEELRSVPQTSIFKPSSDSKEFLSFDMNKANFSSMCSFDSSMFNDKREWEKFVEQFTSWTHIIESKYIREATLGNCNPKRHITYEKWITSKITLEALKGFEEWRSRIVSLTNDEVIFDVEYVSIRKILEFESHFLECCNNFDSCIQFKSSLFMLYFVPGLDGYLEWDIEKLKLTVKSINNFMMPFLCRKLLDEDVKESDKVFIHPNNGLLSKFIEIPDFSISEKLKPSGAI